MPPTSPILRPLALLLTTLALASGRAQEPETQPPPPAPAPPRSEWEGAIGLTVSHRPEYSGGDRQITKFTPAVFLRYGRLTITNASGFVTRRADDVVRGLGLDVVRSERVRLSLSLRFDRGRRENTSEALAGLGDIRQTVRVRTAASWRLEGPWRLGASWSADLLGHGGGSLVDLSGAWEQPLAAQTTLSVGSTLTAGNQRYLQSYFGISEDQAARSVYPVYSPGAGLRDLALFLNLRHEFSADWAGLAGAGVTRLLGPAAASPLTTQRNSWGLSAGFARRF